MSERGKYIVIEGNDGTGKSTQVELLRGHLMEQGIDSVEYHEPAGTPMADAIRTVIKNGSLERDGITNLLLFTAARHEIWNEAKRKLGNGVWVICARNYFSTLAYQGYGEGLDLDLIAKTTADFTDDDYMNPDLAVVLSLDHETRVKRIGQRGELESPDTFESRPDNFQDSVNEGYLAIAKERNLPVIDAGQTPEQIHVDILRYLKLS